MMYTMSFIREWKAILNPQGKFYMYEAFWGQKV